MDNTLSFKNYVQEVFRPKMISAVKNYDRKTFMTDLMAGIIVGILAAELAIVIVRALAKRFPAFRRFIRSKPKKKKKKVQRA